MADSILERAKRLAAAANEVADQMSMQVAEFAGTVQTRRDNDVIVEQQKQQVVDEHAEMEKERNAKLFKGAAISGSSLVTTYGDIRQWAPRGCSIIIDGAGVRLATKGEWTAARVELAEDYAGSTNLDAEIVIPNDAEHAPRGSPKRTTAKAVPRGEINGAISGLDSIKFPTNRLDVALSGLSGGNKVKKKKKPSPSKQLSARSDNSYANAGHDTSTTSTLVPHPPLAAAYTSYNRVGIGKAATAGKRENLNSELFELSDVGTAAMLHEIQVKEESRFPEYSYANMNRRLADEGHSRAQDRVEARKRQIKEAQIEARFADVKEDVEPADVLEKKLQMERQKAMARAAQKRKEDEKRIMEKLEKEEAEREKRAAKMKEKAEKLAINTAERVEKLKRDKALAKAKEEERLAAEQARRIESQNKVAQPGYKDRVDKLRAETEQRLQRLKYLDEEKKLRDALAADRKLKELAEARGRSVPMHHTKGDDDDDSHSRNSSISGRPRSVGSRGKMDKRAPLYNIRSADKVEASPGGMLPSISSRRSSGAGNSQSLMRSTSGGGSKSTAARNRSLAKGAVTSKIRRYEPANPVLDSSNEILVPMHVQNESGVSNTVLRKRTPIQTQRDPQGASDGELSGDSLDDNSPIRPTKVVDQSDAMSFMSALTNDDVQSYAELHDPAEGNKKSMIPKPTRKKKKKMEVWKMQPIPTKPYTQIPSNT